MYYNLRKYFDYIKKEPLKFFGLVYPYILVVIIGVGLIYVNNLDEMSRRKVMPRLEDSAAIKGELKVVEAKSIPPIDIQSVREPNQEMLTNGKDLYDKVCASCHGEDGRGTGPGAGGLNPAPRNFASSDNWKNGPTLSGMYKTLEEGIPGTAMISYDYLTPAEKFGLTHYIRNNFIQGAPPIEQGELQTLDQTYNITQGKEVPAQIPVKNAQEILIAESNKNLNISAVQKKIDESSKEKGAMIFNRIAKNKGNAILWLSRNSNVLQNEKEFRSSMTRFIYQNGFNNGMYGLSSGEWTELYNYLNKILGSGNEV